MSYTIIYGRQFVRTNKGIFPIVLCGESNVWEPSWSSRGSCERRERHWNIFYNNDMCEVTEEALMEKVYTYHLKPEAEMNEQVFMRNGKWMGDKECIRFFKDGIKYAKTLEEINEIRPGMSLLCYVVIWNTDGDPIKWEEKRVLTEYVCTTEALSEWISKAKEIVKEQTSREGSRSVYICMDFPEREPLGIERQKALKDLCGPVIVKREGDFISQYSEKSITTSRSIKDAMVFANAEIAKAVIPAHFGPYTYLDAKKKEKEESKKFALKVEGRIYHACYVSKLTRTKLRLSDYEHAKKFETEEKARKWAEEHLWRFHQITGYSVVSE